MKKLAIVAALDQAGGIGRGGRLPWKLPGDLARFKELTVGERPGRNTVIMGRRTWQSIPSKFRPLPGRFNIVLSQTPGFVAEGPPGTTAVAPDLPAALGLVPQTGTTFAIGGSRVFAEAIVHASCFRLYLTRIEKDFNCDTFFPPIPDSFQRIESLPEHEEGGVRYHFETYER